MRTVILPSAAVLLLGNAAPINLRPSGHVHLQFGPTSHADAVVSLRRGESADIAVVQRGVDVVVQIHSPDGALIDEVDSPNGRNGDEPVNIIATMTGDYRLSIRPISPSEPQGAIDIVVRAMRSTVQTAQLRRQRAELRRAAAEWLRRNDTALPASAEIPAASSIPAFDQLAKSAQVIGLGEATHGSRELNDVRVALVKRLVEKDGFRVIAIEDSTDRWVAVEPYVSGRIATPSAPTEWFWIGRRPRHELLEWARSWNLRHPSDLVRIVGVDPQQNDIARTALGPLLERAYGGQVATAWQAALKELAAADEQTLVFADSGVNQETLSFLQNLMARLAVDGPMLKRRLGDADYQHAVDYTRQLAAFADFNGNSRALGKSRDWYMALGVLRAMDQAGPGTKAIYWGHNAHVSAAASSSGTTGSLLRDALGCGYRAVATTFGQGGFLAELPNDLTDRLHINSVGPASEESVESVLAEVRGGIHIASWACGAKSDQPPWLSQAQKMRWVGGLYDPNSAPSASYRPFRLTDAFDAVVYVPVVKAEGDPGDQPVIPARKR